MTTTTEPTDGEIAVHLYTVILDRVNAAITGTGPNAVLVAELRASGGVTDFELRQHMLRRVWNTMAPEAGLAQLPGDALPFEPCEHDAGTWVSECPHARKTFPWLEDLHHWYITENPVLNNL